MSTTQELQPLLDTAVQSIVVRPLGQLAPQYSIAAYGQALREVRRRYAPDLRRALRLLDIEITDPSARDTLLKFLRTALQEYIHEDRIQTAIIKIDGGRRNGYGIRKLAKKLLQLAIALGPGKAAALFMDSVAKPHCQFHRVTLIGGVKIEAPVELYDGVRIISLSEQDTELPGFLPQAATFHNLTERFRGAVLLVEDLLMSPRYMNPKDYLAAADLEGNTPFRATHRSTDVPDFNSSQFCNALAMVIRARVLQSIGWQCVSEDEIANLKTGGSSSYSWTSDPHPERRVSVNGQQIQEAKRVYELLTDLNPDDSARLWVPVARLNASWGDRQHVDQILDLAIALESLYLPDGGGELGYRLRTRAARYLETGLAERQELAGQLKAFYKARSAAVHTGVVSDTYKVLGRQVNFRELIREVQELCLRSIRQVVDSGGFPDWQTVELG